jgi:hypothetical protein
VQARAGERARSRQFYHPPGADSCGSPGAKWADFEAFAGLQSGVVLRRETIIALRARHTAFRMAMDILYPQQQPSPPDPIPAAPATDIFSEQPIHELPDWLKRKVRRSEALQRRRRLLLAWWVMGWVVFGVVATVWFIREVNRATLPPPPPPARPISSP